MPLSVQSAESTDLFVGSTDAPLQVVRVAYAGAASPAPVRVDGQGLAMAGTPTTAAGDGTVDVPVVVTDPRPGQSRAATVTYLIPLFGALFAWLFLGEPVTLQMLLAGGLVLGSVAVSQR